VIDQGDGPPVLLLHGEGATADVWRDLGELLSVRFRTIAPDGDPADVLDRLEGERMAVIGERQGTVAALRMAERADVVVLLAPTTLPEVGAIDAPVLIFAGEHDPLAPGIAEALNEAIPTSTLGLLPDVGHDVIAEAGATIFPMVYEYLRARYLAEPHGHAGEGVVRIQLERRPPWVAATQEDD